MIGVKLLVRRCVIAMWIATAFTLGLNIYAGLVGNMLLIGIGLGVALSYAITGIAFGFFAARAHGHDAASNLR